jgi:hypothetical protein
VITRCIEEIEDLIPLTGEVIVILEGGHDFLAAPGCLDAGGGNGPEFITYSPAGNIHIMGVTDNPILQELNRYIELSVIVVLHQPGPEDRPIYGNAV